MKVASLRPNRFRSESVAGLRVPGIGTVKRLRGIIHNYRRRLEPGSLAGHSVARAAMRSRPDGLAVMPSPAHRRSRALL